MEAAFSLDRSSSAAQKFDMEHTKRLLCSDTFNNTTLITRLITLSVTRHSLRANLCDMVITRTELYFCSDTFNNTALITKLITLSVTWHSLRANLCDMVITRTELYLSVCHLVVFKILDLRISINL
jgi:hypothetical protein